MTLDELRALREKRARYWLAKAKRSGTPFGHKEIKRLVDRVDLDSGKRFSVEEVFSDVYAWRMEVVGGDIVISNPLSVAFNNPNRFSPPRLGRKDWGVGGYLLVPEGSEVT